MTFKVKDFGTKDYVEIYNLMRNFTLSRNSSTKDEIWLVEHPSVYTLGFSKKQSILLTLAIYLLFQQIEEGKLLIMARVN